MKRISVLIFLWAALYCPVSAQAQDFDTVLRQVEGLVDLIDLRQPAANATVRYGNGQIATNLYDSKSATWYWPNGKVITNLAQSPSATWYWPNGKVITFQIGSSSATWYWPDGQMMSLSGSGVRERELSNTPALAAKILRLAVRNGHSR